MQPVSASVSMEWNGPFYKCLAWPYEEMCFYHLKSSIQTQKDTLRQSKGTDRNSRNDNGYLLVVCFVIAVLSSDFQWSFHRLVLSLCPPHLITLQLFSHAFHCSPLIMFNSPPALPRLPSPCVIPLRTLCFRLVLITPPSQHSRV